MNLPDWNRSKILIIGDIILDRFVYGTVERISPEAPIPVVDVTGETALPGGAANVAANISALGGDPILLGIVGRDSGGELLRDVLKRYGIDASGLITAEGRQTTVKTRIVAHQQQVVRVDREKRKYLDDDTRGRIADRIKALMEGVSAVVVSDYAKGTLDPELLKLIGNLSLKINIPYIVDPKPAHFPYPGASLVTPNRSEAAKFIGGELDLSCLQQSADNLLGRTDWKAVLFTLGSDGMALAERDKPVARIMSRVREVFDVTGAGDTVAATVTLALAAGSGLFDAATVANAAAGVVVGKVGTAVCTPDELGKALKDISDE